MEEERDLKWLGCLVVTLGSAILWVAFFGWIKLLLRLFN